MFKIGDKVKILHLSDCRASDLDCDYQCDLAEGVIKEKTYEKLSEILDKIEIGESLIFTVTEVDNNGYCGLRLGKMSMRSMFPPEELVKEESN